MISALLEVASSDPAPPAEDWVARALAVLGLIVSVITLLHGIHGAYWKRRSNVPDDARDLVVRLQNDLSGALQNPSRIEQLSAIRALADGDRLTELANRVADRRLSARLILFRRDLDAARVPVAASGVVTLTHPQLERIRKATETAQHVLDRVDQLARKSPG